MLHRLSLVLVLLGLSSAAHAATISLLWDGQSTPRDFYQSGDTIQIDVVATANAGELSVLAFGELLVRGGGPAQLIPMGVTQHQLLSFGGAIPWILGVTGCDGERCTLMNQIGITTPLPVSNTPFTIASVSFLVAGDGIVETKINIGFDPTSFDFFGAPVPASTCLHIMGDLPGPGCPPLIPEPATGALLALGLLGLAAGRQRRAC